MNRLNPVTVMLFVVPVSLLSMLSINPICAVISLLGAVSAFCMLCRFSASKEIIGSVSFVLLMSLVNPLFSHNGKTVLFFINSRAFTLEALVYGAVSATAFLSVIYWFRLFSFLMTEDKIIYLIGGFAPKSALAFSISMRLIPKMTHRFKESKAIRQLLNSKKDNEKRFSLSLSCLSSTLTFALESSADTADSMTYRGWGKKKRTRFKLFAFAKEDIVLCTAVAVISAVIMFLSAYSAAKVSFYPEFKMTFNRLDAAFCLSFAALSFLPFLFELSESIKWKFLRSKI